MVFTVSSVVLSFALGIIASLIYITSMKTLGKGFFLLMHLISISFVLLSLISSSSNTVKVFSLLCAILSALCIYFLYAKLPKTLFQQLFSTITLILLLVSLFIEVHQTKNITKEVFEFLRIITGGLLLGGSLTAMLLGHWYLVQPGLNRTPIKKMCEANIVLLIVVCMGWVFKPSMLQVFSGEIKDGWDGMLANMWAGASIASLVILIMSLKALAEKSYTAVMATTGLLYLATLMIAGVELIPRSIFS